MKRVLLFLLILLTATSQCSAYTTYTNLSFYNVSASDVIALGSEYNGSDLVSIEATIIDDATKNNTYDINRSGLVGEWLFENGINDSSNYDNDGTLYGSNFSYVNGKQDNGGNFDGITDYIDVGNNESIDLTHNISIESYVYYEDILNGEYYIIVSKRNDSNANRPYTLQLYGDSDGYANISFSWRNSDGWHSSTTITNIMNERWYLITSTYNAVTPANIYINGEIQPTSTSGNITPLSSTIDPLYIGSYYDNINNIFYGIIDTVRIYNTVLTPTRIKHNYIEKLSQLQLNTTTNTTLSTYWNTSSDNPNSLYFDAFELFSSIIPTVPSSILSNGTTVYDYQNSTQFDINISLGIDNADVLNLTIINETQSLLYFNVTYTADYPTFNIAWDGRANNGTANTSTLYYQNGTSITSNSTYVANSVLLVPGYKIPSDTTYYIQESTTWTVAAGSIFADIINAIYYNGTVTYSTTPTQSSINLSAIFEPRMEVP